ncbi:MAG TPA: hypothetical protein ENI85_09040 [Deltaproteobacteria bacterium]|nr:hypothetical protein [Deltaproteobacteria bacterium]
MNTFHEMTELSQGEFADACGKRQSNMSAYLRGQLTPQRKVLWSSLEHFFQWRVTSIAELEPLPSNLNTLPTDPGIYVFYDSAGNVLYIGKATNLRTEIRQTLGRSVPEGIRFGPTLGKSHPRLRRITARYSAYSVPSPRLRHNLEALLLRVHPNQTHNQNIGNFK